MLGKQFLHSNFYFPFAFCRIYILCFETFEDIHHNLSVWCQDHYLRNSKFLNEKFLFLKVCNHRFNYLLYVFSILNLYVALIEERSWLCFILSNRFHDLFVLFSFLCLCIGSMSLDFCIQVL